MENTIPIKIFFASFWKGFDPHNNFFLDVLSEKFNMVIDSKKPDILIHSIFNKEYLKYDCIRIGYTGENTRPDFKRSDYYIGFDYLKNERYLRWPLFLFATPPHQLINKKNIDEIVKQKRKFAAFVVSNSNANERIDFFKKMSQYRKVSSGGKVLNNIGYRVDNINEFLSQHKFTIAFENSSYPGYTTEKLTQAMRVGSIPIYWGNPRIGEDFNTKSFINLHDFGSFDAGIEYIKKVDSDHEIYKKMLEEPWFRENKIPNYFQYDILYEFMRKIFSQCNKKLRKSSELNDKVQYFITSKIKIIK